MSRTIRLVLIAALGVAAVLTTAGPASAGPLTWSWVQADQPSTSSYFAPGGSSAGQSNQVSRSGVGVYTVYFRGISSSRGTVGVTAESGSLGRHCKVDGWFPSSGGNTQAAIRCFLLNGTPTDTAFYAFFLDKTGTQDGRYAYLWTDRPSAAGTYTVSPTYSYNSTGGVNRITHLSTGRYSARLAGQGVDGGTVKISAYGGGAAFCNAVSNTPGPNGRQDIVVACWNSAGAAVDSAFTLQFTNRRSLFGVTRPGGHAYANQPFAGSPYTPDARFSYNSTGSGNRVENGTIGDKVVLKGLTQARGLVAVTAFSSSPVTCSSGFQNDVASPDKTITTVCADRNGNVVDVPFTVQYAR